MVITVDYTISHDKKRERKMPSSVENSICLEKVKIYSVKKIEAHPNSSHRFVKAMALQINGNRRKGNVVHRALSRLTSRLLASIQQVRILPLYATCTHL